MLAIPSKAKAAGSAGALQFAGPLGAFMGTAGIDWNSATFTLTFGVAASLKFAGSTSGLTALRVPAVAVTGDVYLPSVAGILATLGPNAFTGQQDLPVGSLAAPSLRFGSNTFGVFASASRMVLTASGSEVVLIGPGTLHMGAGVLLGWAGTGTPSGSSVDAYFSRVAAATIRLGGANSPVPVNQTLQAQGGSGVNASGAAFTVRPGPGSGSAIAGALILQSYEPVASGSGTHTAKTTITLNGGLATFADKVTVTVGGVRTVPVTVGTLPSAAASGDGTRNAVNDATMSSLAGTGTIVVGGGANIVSVFAESGNWRIG